jgi:integral membrane protein
MPTPADRTGRAFAVVALVEACTWAGLLVGMVLKHVTHTTELGVAVFGRLHGGAFLVYVAVALVAAVRLRWPWWVTGLALAAAVPPLVTLPLERWLRRTGRLARPVATTSDDGDAARATTPVGA